MPSNIRDIIICSFVIALLGGCYSPPTDIPPGNKEVEIFHDDYLRRTNFYIPKRLKRRNRSLVLCLHNEGETPESMKRLTRHRFNELADHNGFIIGYPEGLNKYWNDGREDSISLSHYNQIDDVGFIEKLIDYSIDSFRVDADQIFVTGLSNGGFMTFRLACELSKKIKGIASVSASLALDQLVNCSADSTVSVMIINGTRDPMMPYDGGEMIVDERSQGSILGANETIEYWMSENTCKEKSNKKDISNTNLFDETRSELLTYSSCDNKAKVALITVTNGGHTWPGGRQYMGEKTIGKTAKDFDASKEIWKFFKGL
jgi:polyhydroxybutyrate depolymerase